MINFAARKGYYIRMSLSDIYREGVFIYLF